MKKSFFIVAAMLCFAITNAQNNGQTAKGKWLVEANTNFGIPHASSTSIGFASTENQTVFNFGAEGGYFIADNFALKLGLGLSYSKLEISDVASFDDTSFSYKLGGKYYISGIIPVQVDISGRDDGEFPDYLGIQAGYAWFLGDMISIEPGLRYNVAINEFQQDVFQLNIGFALHF